jgi:tetratricopeptide (TPR) repeat protein
MSLKAQPESEVSSLIAELNHFMKTSDFSELDLKRLKKKAENIKNNVDLAAGFSLLGAIASLENDIEAMRSYSERAIQQSGGDPLHILNYSSFLKHFKLYEEAYEQALKAYEKDPSDTDSLNELIELACIQNKKDDFEKYSSAWYKLFRKDHKLKTSPLFFPIKPKEFYAFFKECSEQKALPPGHVSPGDILTACAPAIVRFFGTPISVILEIMPDPESNAEPELIAFIQWFGDMEEGMKRDEQFEKWYIENDYDLKTELVFFNIEFVENK